MTSRDSNYIDRSLLLVKILNLEITTLKVERNKILNVLIDEFGYENIDKRYTVLLSHHLCEKP